MERIMAPMLGLTLMALLLTGCVADQPVAELDLEVTSAEVREGDCTFGARDQASDEEWCHVLRVRVENRDSSNSADVSRTSWEADDDNGETYTHPAAQPGDPLPAGQNATIELRFAAPPDVRLQTLRHIDTFGGQSGTSVPDYE